jgi:probable HAF family extracellular repeat protein
MSARQSHLIQAATAVLLALSAVTAACRDAHAPNDPMDLARKPTGGPSVSSVDPDSSQPGVTLDITVNGSGFDQGSTVRLERGGAPASGVTTNATTYVTSRKLIANITIAAAADTGKYDVAVTTSGGRKGVGIELFTVTYVVDPLGVIGGTWSRANAVNENGEVVGESCTSDCLGTAFYWTDAGGLEDLGRLPGYSRGAASAINSRGQVFGHVFCHLDDPGCSGLTKQKVRWDRTGGGWSITPINECSLLNDKFLINDNDQCVKAVSTSEINGTHLLVQTLSGTTAVTTEPLPSLQAGGWEFAYSISNASMVAGQASSNGSSVPVTWYRRANGSWVLLPLGMPGSDNVGRALGISEPDATGRVYVSGATGVVGGRSEHAVRWTLEPDGLGGLRVVSLLALEYATGGGTFRTYAIGWAVNESGDVAGQSGNNAVRWPPLGGVETLPTGTPGASGRALDINSQGWIVGAVWDQQSGCDRAVIWRLR